MTDYLSSSLLIPKKNNFLYFLKVLGATLGGFAAIGLLVYGFDVSVGYLASHYGEGYALGFVFFLVALFTAIMTVWGPE